MKRVVYTVRTANNQILERTYTPKNETDYVRVINFLEKNINYCLVRLEEINLY